MAFRINKDTHSVDATMVDGTSHLIMFQGTVIKEGAWQGDTNLKEIEISGGVTEIRTGAFEDCTSLTKVILPKSVKIIRRGAFAGCTALETVITPDTLKSVEYWTGRVSKTTCFDLAPAILTEGPEIHLLYEGDYDPHFWD